LALRNLPVLERKLAYAFADYALLRQALTHRSFSSTNNERLEFLGDGILDALVAKLLYNTFTYLSEGELSRFRSRLVRQEALYEVALELELGDYLRMGEGELKSGGFRRPSILADAFEAVLGAIWLDGGYDAAEDLVNRLFKERVAALDPKTQGKDNKSLLQEWLQAERIDLPLYEVINTIGEAHEQEFTVCCTVEKLAVSAQGVGMSRRAAEQDAAEKVYQIVIAMPVKRAKR
jgi:ribonuclease-3